MNVAEADYHEFELPTPTERTTQLHVLAICDAIWPHNRDKYRKIFAEARWPDIEYPDRREDHREAALDAEATLERADWDFPEFRPAEGNDYPNVVYFILRRVGLLQEPADQPPKPGKWEPSRWKQVVSDLRKNYAGTRPSGWRSQGEQAALEASASA